MTTTKDSADVWMRNAKEMIDLAVSLKTYDREAANHYRSEANVYAVNAMRAASADGSDEAYLYADMATAYVDGVDMTVCELTSRAAVLEMDIWARYHDLAAEGVSQARARIRLKEMAPEDRAFLDHFYRRADALKAAMGEPGADSDARTQIHDHCGDCAVGVCEG